MTSVILSPTQCKKLTTWTVAGRSAVAIPNTGNTAENTLATLAIAAGSLGPNGILRVWGLISCTNNANAKTIRAKLGSATFFQMALTTSAALQWVSLLRNRNNQALQVGGAIGSVGYGQANAAIFTSAIDTSLAQNLTITAQLGNSADTITLEAWQAEVYYGA